MFIACEQGYWLHVLLLLSKVVCCHKSLLFYVYSFPLSL